jgi:hypothetical protein
MPHLGRKAVLFPAEPAVCAAEAALPMAQGATVVIGDVLVA